MGKMEVEKGIIVVTIVRKHSTNHTYITYIPRPRWEVEKGSVSIVRRHATVIHTYIPRPMGG
jgi:hypothetical protein